VLRFYLAYTRDLLPAPPAPLIFQEILGVYSIYVRFCKKLAFSSLVLFPSFSLSLSLILSLRAQRRATARVRTNTVRIPPAWPITVAYGIFIDYREHGTGAELWPRNLLLRKPSRATNGSCRKGFALCPERQSSQRQYGIVCGMHCRAVQRQRATTL